MSIQLAGQKLRLEQALQDWTALLGEGHVLLTPNSLRVAETATFATEQRVPAILRPGSRPEVQECLRVANRFRVPVYPVSTGKNWGYGSSVPVTDGCVLLDLGRLNHIVDFSEELAYVTVEPGVTQRQLYDFLRTRQSRLWLDATGSSPDCSLIGNAMERGFGHTPYGDHFAHACGLEIVLPTGECVQTGFARFEGCLAASLSRWGLGPAVDGLFSQSNLGIVTRMTVWLMPAPEYFQAFYFRCEERTGLGPLIEALRPLRLDGTVRSTVHVGNDYKVISGIQQYPWEETGGRIPLNGELMRGLRKRLQVGAWSGSGALYGTRAKAADSRRLLRRALAGKVKHLQFLDDRMLNLAGRFAKPYRWMTGWDLGGALQLIRPVYGLMQGIPTNHSLASTYWRKRHAIPAEMNPDRDRCGLLWCAPTAPATGQHAAELTHLAEDLLLAHGFEPMISISMVSERALTCVISIIYDRDVPGEDERASRCHDELLQGLVNKGYHPYRLGIQSMDEATSHSGYDDLLRKIKSALDPHEILAPGRYQPRPFS